MKSIKFYTVLCAFVSQMCVASSAIPSAPLPLFPTCNTVDAEGVIPFSKTRLAFQLYLESESTCSLAPEQMKEFEDYIITDSVVAKERIEQVVHDCPKICSLADREDLRTPRIDWATVSNSIFWYMDKNKNMDMQSRCVSVSDVEDFFRNIPKKSFPEIEQCYSEIEIEDIKTQVFLYVKYLQRRFGLGDDWPKLSKFFEFYTPDQLRQIYETAERERAQRQQRAKWTRKSSTKPVSISPTLRFSHASTQGANRAVMSIFPDDYRGEQTAIIITENTKIKEITEQDINNIGHDFLYVQAKPFFTSGEGMKLEQEGDHKYVMNIPDEWVLFMYHNCGRNIKRWNDLLSRCFDTECRPIYYISLGKQHQSIEGLHNIPNGCYTILDIALGIEKAEEVLESGVFEFYIDEVSEKIYKCTDADVE